ncbi:MAG: pilus assembly protein N-terminal domain-containing protein [Candidatus Saccharimonas sp.]|nr:pilus assembly protein N-terminal domain-containing protein [Planctomycetaceae bacterium]
MKLTTHRMLGWQTSCLRAFVVIFGFALALTIVDAQESKPVGEAAKPAGRTVNTTKPSPARPAADPKMPDISGAWRMGEFGEAMIRRGEDGPADFVLYVGSGGRIALGNPIKWVQETQRFTVTTPEGIPPGSTHVATGAMQLLADRQTMRFTISVDDRAMKELREKAELGGIELEKLLNQEWTRIKKPVPPVAQTTSAPSSKSDPTEVEKPDKPVTDPVEAAVSKAGHLKVFTLANGSAVEYSKQLNDLSFNAKITADPRTNTVIVQSHDEEQLQIIEAILLRLDEAPSKSVKKEGGSVSFTEDLPSSTIAADSKMPDITGTWQVRILNPENQFVDGGEMEIRRIQNGATDFLLDQPWVTEPTRVSVNWSAARQRFEGVWKDDDGTQSKITLQLLADSKTMRVIISERNPTEKETLKDSGTKDSQSESHLTQEWTRTSLSLSTTFPAKRYGLPETTATKPGAIDKVHEPTERMEIAHGHIKALTTRQAISRIALSSTGFIDVKQLSEKEIVVIGRGVGSTSLDLWFDKNPEPRTILVTVTREGSTAGLDTPTAKKLVEQLQAQESAAAAEAATIRQLQANGQAEQNQQPIAEHQRKLKNLLSTAFDLKLQWEELQVKELQSRLSRLERQIGQRKELREKIIARRAGELIDGDVLQWDSEASQINSDTNSNVRGEASSTSDAERKTNLPDVREDPLRSGSPYASYQDLAVKLASAHRDVVGWKHTVQETEQLVVGGEASLDRLSQVRNNLNEALRKLKPIQDEYIATLRELELQIESAQAEVDAAKKHADRFQQAVTAGAPITHKESEDAQLRLKQATLTLERLKVRHDLYKKAGESVAVGDKRAGENLTVGELLTSEIDRVPSPKQLREMFDRVVAANERVRELEATYLRDRTGAADLQRAFDEMTQARRDLSSQVGRVEDTLEQVTLRLEPAEVDLKRRLEAITNRRSEGQATEAELKALADSMRRESETLVTARARCVEHEIGLRKLMQLMPDLEGDEPVSYPNAPAPPQPGYHPDVAIVWLEAATDLKLEFVRFDDLKLWFKAALRVRESSGEHKAGDLIVALNGRLFESLDQAVVVLKPSTQLHLPGTIIQTPESTFLRGGLAGQRQRWVFQKTWQVNYLESSQPDKAGIQLEVRVRREGTDNAETKYIIGACVSPDGLVVIPVSSQSLVVGEAAVVYGMIKGTARVVASDDTHGLTLLKLEAPNQRLFPWLKCRAANASKGQQLQLFDSSTNGSPSTHAVSVLEVGQPLPKPLVGNDAFAVDTLLNVVVPSGARLVSVGNELQGIVIASAVSPKIVEAPDKPMWKGHIAIPAVHIEKLVNDYRKAAAQQAQKHAALETPAATVSLGAEATSELIWEKIGLKFGEPVTAEKLGLPRPKYHGGLPIVEVRNAGSDPKDGIRQGDVLVGLHKWETMSLDNILWILKQSETQPKPDQAGLQLKFFVIREGETRSGFLSVEGQTAGTPKNVPPQSTAKSLDEWLAVLRASRGGAEVVKAAREIAKLSAPADAERAASALLAAAEHFGATSQTDANEHALVLAMRKLDLLGKTPALVNALRDGSPRVRLFALNCLDSLKDVTVAKDFPALAEQVLKIAAGEELVPKLISLRLLGETLPITRLDPAEFTTEERRELARRLVEFVPRDRALQLLVTTLSDKQIDAALEAALQLAKQPEDGVDAATQKKMLDVLANVTKGRLGEATASRDQRQLAFDGLYSLGRRAAPAIPTLIGLLTSDDPDLKANETAKPSASRRDFDRRVFTKSQIIQVIHNLGPAAKNALPELEAVVPILRKKEQEDAVLSPKTPRSPDPHSNQLRNAINRIKLGGIHQTRFAPGVGPGLRQALGCWEVWHSQSLVCFASPFWKGLVSPWGSLASVASQAAPRGRRQIVRV